MSVAVGSSAGSPSPESKLIAFYKGGHDNRGRTLDQMLAASDSWLEATHDYIQWAFPLPERSAFNPAAPLLCENDAAAFQQEPVLQARLAAMAGRMLEFYGLSIEGDPHTAPVVKRSAAFDRRARQWITPGNHNFLRLTRILRSMSLLGLQHLAQAILAELEGIARAGSSDIIGPATLQYWRKATAETYI